MGLTCSFLTGVLCPAATGSCAGWFSDDVGSAALDIAFSVSLFSCGLASESAPDSVVMVNHAGVGGKRRGQGESGMSQLARYELISPARRHALGSKQMPGCGQYLTVE